MARKRKAPPGTYWRGGILWGRVVDHGREVRWSLETSNPKVAAERRDAGKSRVVALRRGDARRTVHDLLDEWTAWLERERSIVGKTLQRYLCSMGQLAPFIDGRELPAIDGKLVADIIRVRGKQRITTATVKRDLVALSSFCNFCVAQGYRDDNPVLARMRQIRERRDPIELPGARDIELVIDRCAPMVADMVRLAMATGARQDELLNARRDHVDHGRHQMTLIGKRNKRRVIDLEPFGGYDLIRSMSAETSDIEDLLFPFQASHNFASRFYGIVHRTQGIRPFRFHDLRHWHAVQWLKDGRSIYDLKARLGHTSVRTTEMYLEYLTSDEQRVAKGEHSMAQIPAQAVPLKTVEVQESLM